MDLAKIRKKNRTAPLVQQSASGSEGIPTEATDAPVIPELAVAILDVTEQICVPETSLSSVQKVPTAPAVPAGPREPFDPLAVLLAGRKAAGCDEEVQQTSAELAPAVQNNYEEFLCFRVSAETYGINIMQIKEIIKPRPVTEVPRSPSFVSGVISLRGVIIPVIDMRDRLGLSREHVTGKERIVVVKSGDAYAGLLVDQVVQVVRIFHDSFEPAPSILDGIDLEFVSGIGRTDQRMVILLNVENITDINLY